MAKKDELLEEFEVEKLKDIPEDKLAAAMTWIGEQAGETKENDAFENAAGPEEQVDSLKEMLDVFMQGAHKVREKIDTFNDRRWQR